MAWKCCFLSLITIALTLVVTSAACPDGCTCKDKQKTMICTGLSSIPTDATVAQYTEFIFDNCNFHTELSKMPGVYNSAHILQVIHSGVEAIAPKAFEDLKNLTMLSLRGNRIKSITSAELAGLQNLQDADFQGNQISVIEDEIFKDSPLINKVIFSDNPITMISDRAFAQPEDADRVSKIQYIELENCNLDTIPTAALCMSSMVPNLLSLDLSHNNLSQLEEDLFKHLSELEQLELDSCEMERITKGTLAGMTKLISLRLSYNRLTFIEEDSFEDFFTTLRYVHLDNNHLTTLPYGLFNWATIQVLNISNNPWHCDCTNGWIQEYNVTPNNTHYNVTCGSPDEYKNKNAFQVMKIDMEPCSPPGSGPDPKIALYIAIPIIIILGITTIFIIVKICILKKKDSHGRSAQYSLVYKPTTEKV